MNAAVHGKASLAELLMADSASTGKNGDDDKDKTNTVDFGATLMNLIDQSAGRKEPADTVSTLTGAGDDSSRARSSTARGDRASSSSRADASTSESSTELFTKENSASASTILDALSSTESGIAAAGTLSHLSSRASNAYGDAIAKAGNNHSPNVAVKEPNSSDSKQITKAAPDQDDPQTHDTTFSNATGSPPDLAEAEVACVPTRDTVLDFPKEPFLPPRNQAVTNEKVDPNAPAVGDFAKAAHLDPKEAATPAAASSKADTAVSSRLKTPPVEDGTSPAPPNHEPIESNLNSFTTKMPQDQIASARPEPSVVQPALKSDIAQATEIAPQQQRPRSADSKENSPQTAAVLDPTGDGARPDATAPAHPVAVAAIRPTNEVTAAQNSSRSVNLTVQLAEGQAAQASVRQHAGAVDVRILSPSPASAQRVSSELDAMRQNLNAAGIKLGNAEVSYQHGDGRQQGEQDQPRAQQQSSDDHDVFLMDEVTQ